mgnify:CR=1 FL=1
MPANEPPDTTLIFVEGGLNPDPHRLNLSSDSVRLASRRYALTRSLFSPTEFTILVDQRALATTSNVASANGVIIAIRRTPHDRASHSQHQSSPPISGCMSG